MPVARVNDIELNYKVEGDGEETIVLINGLADDHQTWVLQIDDFLAEGYRVLRFDNRGDRGEFQAGRPLYEPDARRRREGAGRFARHHRLPSHWLRLGAPGRRPTPRPRG
jgi:pimeloyl-ACP methyl ester carboxylesterase